MYLLENSDDSSRATNRNTLFFNLKFYQQKTIFCQPITTHNDSDVDSATFNILPSILHSAIRLPIINI